MHTIVSKLVQGEYSASEQDIESLALERYNNHGTVNQTDNTYLRVLTRNAQSRNGTARNRRTQVKHVNAAHVAFYAAVIRGVTTHDIAHDDTVDKAEKTRRSLERNRRSAFARTSKSTLVGYIKSGGDLRALDIGGLTKSGLRCAMKPPEPKDKIERQIERAQGGLLRALTRKFRVNAPGAEDTIEAAQTALGVLLKDQLALLKTPVAKARKVAATARRGRSGHRRPTVIPASAHAAA